jgi:hypothetical protein
MGLYEYNLHRGDDYLLRFIQLERTVFYESMSHLWNYMLERYKTNAYYSRINSFFEVLSMGFGVVLKMRSI